MWLIPMVDRLITMDENDVFWHAFTTAFLLCVAFHFAFRAFFKRYFRDAYYTLNKSDRISLAEKTMSTAHGLLVGILAIKLIWVDDVWKEDVVDAWHPLLAWLFGTSSGYEVYDMLTMYFQYDQGILMWIHHLVIVLGYQICLTTHLMSFMAVLLLITELTVLPSNIHWYLKVLGKKDTRAFHFNQGLRLWSFVVLRLFMVPYALTRLYFERERFLELSLWVQCTAIGIACTLGYMNLHWTRLLWKIYQKRERLWQTRLRQAVEKKKAALAQKNGKANENEDKATERSHQEHPKSQ
eukprot:TRINITY_DN3121_c0_g2_i1.p1 TRINITY_DN3121_c0_g2~~TRINITY_DN3121_c0_g2_i1.p1  ORF type:complete len:296 (+),score=112.06 TRINITY_DN3121_c0_g2_i1:268-1155(+)